MTRFFRVPKSLYEGIRDDLYRPHTFAAERVGFAKARLGSGEGMDRVVILTGYEKVADGEYINDPTSGARIDGDAIRRAMSLTLEEDVGVFHVHFHDHAGIPGLGRMDRREIPRLVTTLVHTNPRMAHGILVLSRDSLSAWVRLPGGEHLERCERVSVIGNPLLKQGVLHVD